MDQSISSTLSKLTADEELYRETPEKQLDTGVVYGIGIAAFLLFVAIVATGKVTLFINPLGLLIVVGGTLAASMIQFSIYEVQYAWKALKAVLFTREQSSLERILYFVELAQHVRRDGLLVLDNEAQKAKDDFLRKALEITVDGTDPGQIRHYLETDIRTSAEEQRRGIHVFQTMASYAPAFGLIGTLIGLVNLLGSLSDPSSVGPAMSVALMTTLYGALLANLIFMPVAGKLKIRSEEDALVKTITIEGVLAVYNQDNPIVVEQKLQSYLPSNQRYS